MTFIYTRSQLLSDIDAGIKGKIGMISNQADLANRVAREVISKNNLRSTRRRSDLTPNLFPGIYQYACPSDLKNYGIIDVISQANRQDDSFNLVPSEQFEVSKRIGDIAVDDYNGMRVLLINSAATTTEQVISELDSTTSGGGTWVAFGDAENIAEDGDDYIKGSGSLAFGISSAGGTTAGLQNSALDARDMTDFFGGESSVFVWHRISSTTDITNYILRIGSSSGNYYQKTITARHDGNAFQTGWNLLRFDLTNLTTVGTPDQENIDYVAVYMTKATGKISETDYKFDWLVAMKGRLNQVAYYSRFPWQSSTGTYLENSTSPSDLLTADTTEYGLFVKKGIAEAARLVSIDEGVINRMDADYGTSVAEYRAENIDESIVMTSTYYDYGQSGR